MVNPRSPLASRATNPQTQVPPRTNPTPWGVCVHTTGSGVPNLAKTRSKDPLQVALDIYTRPDANFPHYVISNGGTLVQVCDENLRARHAGIDPDERQLYLTGQWKTKVNAVTLGRWSVRWPGVPNPLYLFPSRSPNEDYIGVELIPLLDRLPNGSLFTPEQYQTLGALVADVESRYNIRVQDKRLVGHEDLEPLTRWSAIGGWDPGFLEARPAFLWDLVQRPSGAGSPGVG